MKEEGTKTLPPPSSTQFSLPHIHNNKRDDDGTIAHVHFITHPATAAQHKAIMHE